MRTTTDAPAGADQTTPFISRRAVLAMAGALSGGACASALGVQPAAEKAEPTPAMIAFIMRHGETGGGDSLSDPVLSRAGRDRAARVGAMLRSVGTQRILHTSTTRARETALEISRALGVGVGSYDPFDAEPVTKRMMEGGGVWVVIGHSNTVPELVRKLGGDPSADVLPDTVYDRVYMVMRAGGGVMTVLLHST